MKENQIESYQQYLVVKTYEWRKNSFTWWLNQQKAWRVVLKIDGCVASSFYYDLEDFCAVHWKTPVPVFVFNTWNPAPLLQSDFSVDVLLWTFVTFLRTAFSQNTSGCFCRLNISDKLNVNYYYGRGTHSIFRKLKETD